MRTNTLTFTAVCICTFVIALSGRCLASDTIRINGSGSALDMLKPLIKAYMKNNRGVRIEVEKSLGSSGAIKALMAGVLDVAVSSKQLKDEDIAKGAKLKAYGRTPFAIVTEKSVPKGNITTSELEDIYTGKTSRWQNGELIRLVLRPMEDTDTSILRGLSPGMNTSVTASHSRPGMITAVTDQEAYKTVLKTPGGIGATALISIISERLSLKTLSLDGVSPTTKNLASGAYPMYKEINFVITSRTTPAALKFISFAYSPKGRSIAEKAGVLVTAEAKGNK